MTIKLFLSLFFSLFCFLAHATNSVCSEGFGTMHCGEGYIDAVRYIGNAILSGTHVSGNLSITGNLQATNADVGTANLAGNVDASHLIVHQNFNGIGIYHFDNSRFFSNAKLIGNLKGSNDVFNAATEIVGEVKINSELFKNVSIFTGKIDAEASTFEGPMTLNSCLAKFHQSKLSQVQVTKQSDCLEQKIYLSEGSGVNGDISFQNGNGKVYLSKDSIINGQVKGGVILNI